VFEGIGVSPGIVVGKAYVVDNLKSKAVRIELSPEEVGSEIQRFRDAIALSKEQLIRVKQKVASEIEDQTYAYIIDVHLLIMEDKSLIEETEKIIRDDQVNAEWALRQVIDNLSQTFDNLDNEYFKERKSDITQVGERIQLNLGGNQPRSLDEIDSDVIVIAHDLSPADTVNIHKVKVIGFATELGSRTSHTAILARSLEIPAVVALGNIRNKIKTGDSIILDGIEGHLIPNPTPEVFTEYLEKQRKYIYFEQDLLKLRDLSAETLDGYRIELSANIEFPDEVPSVLNHGAEGIGLYRTEFLYLNRGTLPSEEEQFNAYKRVADELNPRPATIRILDVGGDKIEPHSREDSELNPVLGLRAIRYAFKNEDILYTQLRSILRASVYGNLRIMLPLISGVHELRHAKDIIDRVREDLAKERIPFNESIPLGAMIEVPSAAMTSDLLARECDFFSIGTNDLIQYFIAIDRSNDRVAYLYEPLHPAILRTIKTVIAAAHSEGIWVGMCGEMAGDPLCALILLGMEIDELSMNAMTIPTIKQIIRSVRLEEAYTLAYEVLTCATAMEIEEFISHEMSKRFPDIFNPIQV
jgi:phosphotransferase system enzyme I (PtsI)